MVAEVSTSWFGGFPAPVSTRRTRFWSAPDDGVSLVDEDGSGKGKRSKRLQSDSRVCTADVSSPSKSEIRDGVSLPPGEVNSAAAAGAAAEAEGEGSIIPWVSTLEESAVGGRIAQGAGDVVGTAMDSEDMVDEYIAIEDTGYRVCVGAEEGVYAKATGGGG